MEEEARVRDDGARRLSSGVASLDARLDQGLQAGDNVLWIGPPELTGPFCAAFTSADPADACRVETVGRNGSGDADDVVAVDLADPATTVSSLVATVVEHGRRHRRLWVVRLDEVYVRLGATAAVDLYTRTCPQLFDLGAVAYWPADGELLPRSVLDPIGRVAQVVLEARPGCLRVLKAESRPVSVQGSLSELHVVRGTPTVGRELGAGRLAEGLRRLRKERTLSQKQLAALAGVTPSAISQAETGRRGLSLETLLMLCERLSTSIDELLGLQATPRRLLARREGRHVAAGIRVLHDGPGLRSALYRVELPPLGSVTPFVAHKGTETILVARGLVLVDLGDDTPVLRSGDALVVTRDPVKGWTNLTEEPAELFWMLDAAPGADDVDRAGGLAAGD